MAKYTSTLLPQDNTPQENQKAVLDLLDKTNKVHDDALSGIKAAKAELQKQIDATVSKLHAFVCCEGNPLTLSNTAIIFAEILDTHNTYTLGIFTAPKDGIVIINCCALVGTTAGVLYVGKGTVYNYLYLQTIPTGWSGSGTIQITAIAGDYFYVTADVPIAASTKTSLSFEFIEL